MNSENRPLGFTLIELLLVLGISSLLLVSVLALPAYWVKQSRLMHHTNQFLEALEFARSHAMIIGSTTTICSSDGAARCAGTAYEKGWLVFNERRDSINGALDNGENILMSQRIDAEDLSIRSNTFSRFISYNRFGRANFNGRFILCTKQPTQVVSELIINQGGRVRLVRHRSGGQTSDADAPAVGDCMP